MKYNKIGIANSLKGRYVLFANIMNSFSRELLVNWLTVLDNKLFFNHSPMKKAGQLSGVRIPTSNGFFLKALFLILLHVSLLSCASDATAQNPKLKAILIVGPQEDGTLDAIKSMEAIGNLLKGHGVEVFSFYDDESNWKNIVSAGTGTNFFVYDGHGSNGGGLNLAKNKYISSFTIKNELKLAKNSIIIFQSVCRGAGSSAGDFEDIGLTEAIFRVQEYAEPFFKCGARAYFANNFEDGCYDFIEAFFAGKSISESFEDYAANWCTIETNRKIGDDTDKYIGIASSDLGGTSTYIRYVNGVKSEIIVPSIKNYDIAYIAPPNYSIADLIGATRLTKR